MSPPDTTGVRLSGVRRPWLAVCLLATLIVASGGGCASHQYLKVRKTPKNPLAGSFNLLSRSGPKLTERTQQTLRRFDLEKVHQRDPEAALARMQEEIQKEPSADKLQAYSELAYIAAHQADAAGHRTQALNLYCAAVFSAYDFLFDPLYDPLRNPYDPQFRRACDIYNTGLEAALRLIERNGCLCPGETLTVDTGVEQMRIDVVGRGLPADEHFQKLEFVSDYQITGLKNHHHSYGLGVPLIAVRQRGSPDNPLEKFYPDQLTFPVTAFLRIVRAPTGPPGSVARQCVLELYDPRHSCTTQVAGRLVPLETDLSTPLGYRLENGSEKHALTIATLGLLKPDNARSMQGLYMVEPYDPTRIPVVMVHGLWSSPMTWMEMFNDLLAYPEIRENFQFWFYLYPTGQPFWMSAQQFRQELATIRATLDPLGSNACFEQMILVGHSMGGLVSMMQTLESGEDFWHLLSDHPFAELKVDEPTRESIAERVFFHPNDSVHTLITIATPHRGSTFANDYTRYLARKLIRLPSQVLWVSQRLVVDNPGFFKNTDLFTISTSIDSLAPDSPIFPAMLSAQRAPWVSYHNIVGVVPNDSFWRRFAEYGDGVVAFDSAHRDDFQSELVVDADHMTVHAHPLAILEVRRILLEHLAQVRGTTARLEPHSPSRH